MNEKIRPIIIQLFTVTLLIASIYIVWAIQPTPSDDWRSGGVLKLFKPHALPTTGQNIRYAFDSYYYLVCPPFSFLKPYSFLTSIAMVFLIWIALNKENLVLRFFVTLVTVLGFPYIGHVGAWNQVVSHYLVSLLWVFFWYLLYKHCQIKEGRLTGRLFLLFVMSFIASVWLEVWLISFSMISAYMVVNIFLLYRKEKVWKDVGITVAVLAGYALAVWFYTRGGVQVFLYQRDDSVTPMSQMFTFQHIAKTLFTGAKETVVLLKDSIPLLFLIIAIVIKNNSKPRFYDDKRLLGAMALGVVLFLFVNAFVLGPAQWRTRWLCVFPVIFFAYILIFDAFRKLFERGKITSSQTVWFRGILFALAIMLLSYNTYRTYIYNNVDVKNWLMFRQMVITHDPRALGPFTPTTLPPGRPKGVAHWTHPWGYEDDRYRFLWGPNKEDVNKVVKEYWQSKGWL